MVALRDCRRSNLRDLLGEKLIPQRVDLSSTALTTIDVDTIKELRLRGRWTEAREALEMLQHVGRIQKKRLKSEIRATDKKKARVLGICTSCGKRDAYGHGHSRCRECIAGSDKSRGSMRILP